MKYKVCCIAILCSKYGIAGKKEEDAPMPRGALSKESTNYILSTQSQSVNLQLIRTAQ